MNSLTTAAKNPSVPKIRNYSNIYIFLKDVFNYEKSVDPDFNFDTWSALLGFKSRSFVYMLYTGKRKFTESALLKLNQWLGLTEEEYYHLHLLADLSNAKKPNQKKMFLDKILENLETKEQIIDIKDQARFLSRRINPIVLLLLAFEDFTGTTDQLCKKLSLSQKEVEVSLRDLLSLGLIEKIVVSTEPDYIWKATTKAFSVPDSHKDCAVNLFHQNSLSEALQVLETQNSLKRFRSIFFALEENQFPELLEEIEMFLSKLKNKYGYNHIKGKKLIKLNLQSYNLTNE